MTGFSKDGDGSLITGKKTRELGIQKNVTVFEKDGDEGLITGKKGSYLQHLPVVIRLNFPTTQLDMSWRLQ